MKKFVFGLVLVVAALALMLRLTYGGGEPYPDLSEAPVIPAAQVEIAATSDEPIGNLAVSAQGRLFYTIHPESRPSGPKLLEWVDGKAVAYPSAAAQDALFETVLGMVIDRQNRLWTIDHGNHGSGTARLLAFDLNTGEVVHDHVFDSSAAPLGSFLQDLQVDSLGETVYIADVSFFGKNPALVVYDVKSQTARRVLEDHASVYPQDWIIRNPEKTMVFLGGLLALKPGVDGIALSNDDAWLYYAAMAHDTMYRIVTDDLNNAELNAEQLAERIQAVGKKPLNDGLSIDNAGHVYITDVEHNAVIRMRPDTSELTTMIKDPRIRWPDALSFGADGWLYVADSAIPHQMLQTKAHMAEHAPYRIFRFKPGVEAIAGH